MEELLDLIKQNTFSPMGGNDIEMVAMTQRWWQWHRVFSGHNTWTCFVNYTDMLNMVCISEFALDRQL